MTHRSRTRAFTMIEAMTAVGMVAVLLVVALNTVGASNANQYRTARRATANYLAQNLLNAIVQLPYKDPAATPLFGVEAGETSTSKANYDDVDDFNGWTESPPQDRDGTAFTDLAGWSRSVTVQWVTVASPTTVSSSDTGLKLITVNVSCNGALITTRSALKGSYP
jgi:MSHA pilin protein MshD